MRKILNYIDGSLVAAANGKTLEVFDPSKGKPYTTAPDSDELDVENAIKAASKAFEIWSEYSIEKRSQIMMGLADLIDEHSEELAIAESLDNGKPIWLAKEVDIPRASKNLRFFANAITQYSSSSHDMVEAKAINYTLRQPLGVVATISPWNLPLYLFTWKIAPALAAGNTVVAKPSEVTPLTAFMLSELCIKAGMPEGVLNIVHGYGEKVGNAMTKHPKVKAISFTGSTKVGGIIAKVAAERFKKVSLEMGGKNPNIIFADCDYDEMLETTVRSSFSNQGQICLCGSRILIERKIYHKFKEDFVVRTKALVVGDPRSDDSKLGAVVSKIHMEKILSFIELAKHEGGQILCGGERVILNGDLKDGWYVAPTIIEGLDQECRVNQEEIFGPVVSIMPFETEEEAIKLANGTDYGLSATIWTENISKSQRVARALDAGVVWVNTWLTRDLRTAFGGVKNSGMGREGGVYALDFFTEPKNICIKYQ